MERATQVILLAFGILMTTSVLLGVSINSVLENYELKNFTCDNKSANKLSWEERFSFDFFKTKDKDELKCGQQFLSYSSRIVGGRATSISQFPWMVSLQREISHWFGVKGYAHSCGGSLVSPSWILTAAHCLYNKDNRIRVIGGTDNLDFLYRAQARNVEKVIIHPEFVTDTFDNDIALLKVDKPFIIGSSFSRMNVICLDRKTEIIPYDIAVVCGFGAKAFHRKSQRRLFKIEIAIIDQNTCNRSFEDDITDNMICAGGMIEHKRDACSGDSGGPLQIEDEDHYSLIGVVSFGNDCAVKNYPGIYTRVPKYVDWIAQNIDEPLATTK